MPERGIDESKVQMSPPWFSVLAFGVLVNLLFLISPLFMLQVYDRVLPSGHAGTLLALFAIVAFLYVIQIMVDTARTRILAQIGGGLQARLDRAADTGAPADRNLVYRVFAHGPVLALIDAPWAVLFALVLFWCHPLLGWLSVGGACFLCALVAARHIIAARGTQEVPGAPADAADFFDRAGHLPVSAPMDLRLGAHRAWLAKRERALDRAVVSEFDTLLIQAAARHGRQFLQSASLAMGAFLVIEGQMTAGLMIAASILQGRALAPIEALVGQIDPLLRAFRALRARPSMPDASARFPRDGAGPLVMQGVLVASGGRPLLQIDKLRVEPGQALGVIGPAGSGKTTLAEVLAGVQPILSGQMVLGAMPLPLAPGRGALLGYVAQAEGALAGTIADVIRRYHPGHGGGANVRAATRLLGVEQLIDALPQGFDTVLGAPGRDGLTGGLRQAVALARAFYGAPALIVLDEPNAQLDARLSAALNRAVRAAKQRGAVVVILAHRPASISECDLLLMLEGGKPVAFGPRDEVLQRMVRNHLTPVAGGTGR